MKMLDCNASMLGLTSITSHGPDLMTIVRFFELENEWFRLELTLTTLHGPG